MSNGICKKYEWVKNVRPTRLERATYGFEVRCSIQLSYRRIFRSCPKQTDLCASLKTQLAFSDAQ